MERETKKFTLPSGKEVTLYTYLTAQEANQIKSVMMSAIKVDVTDIMSSKEGEIVPMKGQVDGSILIKQEELLVKFLVKECEGGVDNIRATDYQPLVNELNTIKNGNLVSAK